MRIRYTLLFTALIVLTAIIAGCADRYYLIVDYQVPVITSHLEGQTIQLQIKDLREDKKIFSPEAEEQFSRFKNRYSLAWIKQDGSRALIGEFDLKGIFKKAFAKRLQNLGVLIASNEATHVPVMQLSINHLKIDQLDRKWIATISYEASLSSDTKLIARERVTGSAERIKILGRKGADTVLSDIFTDLLNRLDIVKLFEQAKLIS
ncbi:MAG: hypothetical protein GY874_07165 [Desulfobacteraceae bacterium]|nr:hypothetical protein [Desulfobacteraceae bacterium]